MEQVKISERMAEYVENKEQVEHILNQCEYDLVYVGYDADKKQYKYTLYINDLKFDYFEGVGNEKLTAENKQDKLLNAVWCLLSDRSCVTCFDNEYDFICEFGYNEDAKSMEQGHNIYNNILKNNEKLLKAFSNEQLDFLSDNIQL